MKPFTSPPRSANMQRCSVCGHWCRRTLNVCPTCYPPPKAQLVATKREWTLEEILAREG